MIPKIGRYRLKIVGHDWQLGRKSSKIVGRHLWMFQKVVRIQGGQLRELFWGEFGVQFDVQFGKKFCGQFCGHYVDNKLGHLEENLVDNFLEILWTSSGPISRKFDDQKITFLSGNNSHKVHRFTHSPKIVRIQCDSLAIWKLKKSTTLKGYNYGILECQSNFICQ